MDGVLRLRGSLPLLLLAVVAALWPLPAAAQEPDPPVDPDPPAEESPAEETPSEEEPAVEGGDAGESGDEEEPVELPFDLPTRLEPLGEPFEEREELTIRVTADAECELTIDGVWVATLRANETSEFEVKQGLRRLRTVASELRTAVWEKEVAVREGKENEFVVPVLKVVRKARRAEFNTGLLRDEKSGLMWRRRDNGTDTRWEEALEYCEESGFAGFDDWRLPTLAELEEIAAVWSRATYKIRDLIALTGCCPWSSDREGEARGWNFNYQYRKPFLGNLAYSLQHRALCVRAYDPLRDALPPTSLADLVGEGGEGEDGADAVEPSLEPGSEPEAEADGDLGGRRQRR